MQGKSQFSFLSKQSIQSKRHNNEQIGRLLVIKLQVRLFKTPTSYSYWLERMGDVDERKVGGEMWSEKREKVGKVNMKSVNVKKY